MGLQMRILGIDPGIGRCGWGVLEYRNSKLEVRGFGCIETSPKKKVGDRLKQVHDEVSAIIKKYKPDVLSIEELFFNNNAKTAFVVGQARGVILLAAAENNLEIGIYTPLQVKLSLTGYGRAEKPQVGQMVKVLLKLKEIPKPDDTADALGIAITHAFSSKASKFGK
jgi:crossover junction endodeoxyribonuclease RuvC